MEDEALRVVAEHPLFLGEADLARAARMALYARGLRLLGGATPSPACADGLTADIERFLRLAETMSEQDDAGQVLDGLDRLLRHDPAVWGHRYELALALALVWDRPRPSLHGQMGRRQTFSPPALEALYDFFVEVYEDPGGRWRGAYPPVEALLFVVDVPVSLEALRWARQQVSGTRASWGNRFYEVPYDHARLAAGRLDWPYGDYSLQAIRQRGGLCVDQAYFATLTARAHGIPATMFVGQGRRGGHAWFAFMKSDREWTLDVGRYDQDRYAVGHGRHPQTGLPMSDHDLAYACSLAARHPAIEQGRRWLLLAQAAKRRRDWGALARCAREAREAAPILFDAWALEQEALSHVADPEARLDQLEDSIRAMASYPDLRAQAVSDKAKLLRELGRDAEADARLGRAARRMDNDARDDLARKLTARRVEAQRAEGDPQAARKQMEDLLEAQPDEGAKTVRLMQSYLALTTASGQTREAARFLRRYIESLRRTYAPTPERDRLLWGILLEAYRRDGDESRARRVQRKIDALGD